MRRDRELLETWVAMSSLSLCRAALPLVPIYARHLLTRPLRSGHPREVRKALRSVEARPTVAAARDTAYGICLDAYREMTGNIFAHHTPLTVLLFERFVHEFDDAIDERLVRGESLDFSAVLEDAHVAHAWYCLMEHLNYLGYAEGIRQFVTVTLSDGYCRYVNLLSHSDERRTFGETLELVEFDSGTIMQALPVIIRVTNEHPPHELCDRAFYMFGMTAKFADDMWDLREDVNLRSPNLLLALCQEEPTECARATDALRGREAMNAQWWATHCSQTYHRYWSAASKYYQEIASPTLVGMAGLAAAGCRFVPPVKPDARRTQLAA